MEQPPRKEHRIKKSVSFRPDQLAAIEEQAEIERHSNFSLIVQRAVDRELERSEKERESLALAS